MISRGTASSFGSASRPPIIFITIETANRGSPS